MTINSIIGQVTAAQAASAVKAQPVATRAAVEFSLNPAIRAEFGSPEVYIAYCTAVERGLVGHFPPPPRK